MRRCVSVSNSLIFASFNRFLFSKECFNPYSNEKCPRCSRLSKKDREIIPSKPATPPDRSNPFIWVDDHLPRKRSQFILVYDKNWIPDLKKYWINFACIEFFLLVIHQNPTYNFFLIIRLTCLISSCSEANSIPAHSVSKLMTVAFRGYICTAINWLSKMSDWESRRTCWVGNLSDKVTEEILFELFLQSRNR